MNRQGIIISRFLCIVMSLGLVLPCAHADRIKKYRKPKSRGLLTQNVDKNTPSSLSPIQQNIDVSEQVESSDAPQKVLHSSALSKQEIKSSITNAVAQPIEPTDQEIIAPTIAEATTQNKALVDTSHHDEDSKKVLEKLNKNESEEKGIVVKDNIKNTSTAPISEKTKSTETKTAAKTFSFIDDSDVPSVEFYFENTDLQNLLNQISEIYHVTFITDEAISPLSPTAKAIKGNKISFKTQKPLTKKDAWNLFLTFMDLAGLALVPQSEPKMFRVVASDAAQRSAIRSFIGIDSSLLPDNDEMIRYVYFIENSTTDTIRGLVDSLKSPSSLAYILQESKALILTDKSYNIKMLMNIIKELDKTTMPQAMSVLKLRRVDAKQVKDLYDSIIGKDDALTARLFPNRKQTTSLYFPENTRIFAEPRTNALILLGPKDSIKKIEDFVTEYIDVDIDKPYSPLKVYTLQYADAQTVSDIMNTVTNFGKNTEAGKVGGVRGDNKFLKPMSFTPEKDTNRIVIRGDYDDYLRAVEIIKKLDEPQPQVAIEMLILSVDLSDVRALGSQIRSAVPGINGLVGDNVKFQTSGNYATGTASSIVENDTAGSAGVTRLLGNILNLVAGTSATNPDNTAGPGNTIVSLGMDQFGVWGIFNVLQTVANLQVISNPFVTALNKAPATVTLGQTRRVVTANVVGGATNQEAFGNQDANLTVNITPQINSDGFIVLTLNIQYDEFLDATDPRSARTQKRTINTNTIVADKEVLAVGGLIQNKIVDAESKVPILGDIPILGWLFKNRQKQQRKSNLLVLISTRIVDPVKGVDGPFTAERVKDYRNCLVAMENLTQKRDPIDKWMFASTERDTEKVMDDFIFKRQDKTIAQIPTSPDRLTKAQKRKLARQKKRQQKIMQKNVAVVQTKNTRKNGVLS